MPRGPRQAITDIERKALRDWFRSQYPRPRQKECIAWFHGQYNHKISQSTVSESLGDGYKHLDTDGGIVPTRPSYRQRAPHWPVLEDILSSWQQFEESRGEDVSGEQLIAKAREIWPRIPEYQGRPVPEFSHGWLQRYKQRHRAQFLMTTDSQAQGQGVGASASVAGVAAAPAPAFEGIRAIQALCEEYQEGDIYSMGESGLFWRRGPSSGLTTPLEQENTEGESRVTLVVCTNCTGTDRFPLWIIGAAAEQPRSLCGLNIPALGGEWRCNNKALMSSIITKDWLLQFYTHIGDRAVLLLMDSYLAHLEGVRMAPPPANVRIQWFPVNSTTLFQPLAQGINQSLKLLYRGRWLRFILDKLKQRQDPFSAVGLYHAVHWTIQAWRYEVTNTTIYDAFRKSTVIHPQAQQQLPVETERMPNYHPLYSAISATGQIRDMMSLQSFLNPQDEDVNLTDDGKSSSASRSQRHGPPPTTAFLGGGGGGGQGQVADNGQGDSVAISVPSVEDALQGLQVVFRFMEFQEDTTHDDIQGLERWRHWLLWKQALMKQQATMDRWLA